jgi:hypothetical protein
LVLALSLKLGWVNWFRSGRSGRPLPLNQLSTRAGLTGLGQLRRVRPLPLNQLSTRAGLTGLGQRRRVRPLPLNPDRVNFPFSKSFINSNHFDPNSNLNYE